jgi:biotin carboxyl carrier protein
MIHRYSVEAGGREREVTVEPLGGGRYRVTHDGSERIVDARRVAASARAATWALQPDGGGRAALVDVDGALPDLVVGVGGASLALKVTDARRKLAHAVAATRDASGPTAVRSPMPGKIVKVLVRAGEVVKSGQGVVVVEAMKMENELRAPRDGTVRDVSAQEGQAVEAGQTLATIE